MAEAPDSASPVMGAPAGLHGHDAARALGQKSKDFIARKRLAERHAAVSARAMRLKAPLCKVETDDARAVSARVESLGIPELEKI